MPQFYTPHAAHRCAGAPHLPGVAAAVAGAALRRAPTSPVRSTPCELRLVELLLQARQALPCILDRRGLAPPLDLFVEDDLDAREHGFVAVRALLLGEFVQSL